MGVRLAEAFVSIRAPGAAIRSDLAAIRANTTRQVSLMQAGINRSMAAAGRANTAALGAAATMSRFSGSIAGQLSAVAGMVAAFSAITGGFRAAINFNKEMTRAFAIQTDITKKQERAMSDLAQTIAVKTGVRVEDLARSFFFLKSAGLSFEQQMTALEPVTKFAIAGAFDQAEAVSLLTDAQSALGLKVKDSTKNMENMIRVSDLLVGAQVLADASVRQFATSLARKGGTAIKSMGGGLEEGIATLAVFAEQGTKAELAGRALLIVMRDMQDAAFINPKEFKAFGIDVFDEITGEFLGVPKVIAQMEAAIERVGGGQKGQLSVFKTLGFPKRSKQFIQQLLGDSDKLAAFTKNLKDLGFLTEAVANRQLTSLTAQLGMLRESFKVFAINVLPAFINGFVTLAKPLAILVNFLGRLDRKAGNVGSKILATATAVSAMAFAVTRLLPKLAKMAAGFLFLNVARFFSNITLIGPAIGLITKSVRVLGGVFKWLAGVVSKTFGFIAGSIKFVVGGIGKLIGGFVSIGRLIPKVGFLFKGLGKAISGTFSFLGKSLSLAFTGLSRLASVLGTVVNALSQAASKIVEFLAPIVGGILGAGLLVGITAAVFAIRAIIKQLLKVKRVQESLASAAKAFRQAWERAQKGFRKIGDAIIRVADRIIDRFAVIAGFDPTQNLSTQLEDRVVRMLDRLQDFAFLAADVFNFLVDEWRAVWEIIVATFDLAVASMKVKIRQFASFIGTIFETVIRIFAKAVPLLAEGLATMFKKLAPLIGSAVADAILTAGSAAIEAGAKVAEGFGNKTADNLIDTAIATMAAVKKIFASGDGTVFERLKAGDEEFATTLKAIRKARKELEQIEDPLEIFRASEAAHARREREKEEREKLIEEETATIEAFRDFMIKVENQMGQLGELFPFLGKSPADLQKDADKKLSIVERMVNKLAALFKRTPRPGEVPPFPDGVTGFGFGKPTDKKKKLGPAAQDVAKRSSIPLFSGIEDLGRLIQGGLVESDEVKALKSIEQSSKDIQEGIVNQTAISRRIEMNTRRGGGGVIATSPSQTRAP